jgi:beta-lactamase regulating signal transducer with metallopeptidase domain
VDAVLNWIWQGSVIAAVTTVVLALIERSRARDRYLLVWAAVFSVLAVPIVPLAWEAVQGDAPSRDVVTTEGPLIAMPVAWWTSTTTLVVLWALWSAAGLIRLVRSWVWLRNVRAAASPLSAPRQHRLSHWTALASAGRAASLVVSSHVRSAAVLGWGSPVIAVAPSLLDELEDDELDRIVVHEWAHVRRRDDLMQAVQAGIRVIAGWHPAVWWLDRHLRIEREIACDELAVAVIGSAKGYASSLLKLAELLPPRLAMDPALTAIGPTGLRRRIARILSRERGTSSPTWRAAAVAGGAVLCVLAASLGSIRAIAATVAVAEPAVDGRESPPVTTSDVASRATPNVRSDPGAAAPIPVASSRRARPIATPQPHSAPIAPAIASTTTPRLPEISAARVDVAFHAGAPRGVSPTGDPAAATPVVPWRGAASAGVAVGRESREAAVAAAGYFTRLGKRVAGAF